MVIQSYRLGRCRTLLRSASAPPTNSFPGRHTVAVSTVCLSVQVWQLQLSPCPGVAISTVCLCRCEGVLDCHRHVERGLHYGRAHSERPPAVRQKRDGADSQDLQPGGQPYCSELAQAPGPAKSQEGKPPLILLSRPVYYLASHQIDAERCSLFFPSSRYNLV